MNTATADLKSKLNDKAGMPPPPNGAAPAAPKPQTALQVAAKNVNDWVNDLGPALERALPNHIKLEKLQRAWLTEIRRNLKLLECTRESLQNAMMLSAQLGLLPGPLGHCYAIPFKNNQKKVTELTFIIGYKGMINLSRRSGELMTIRAMMVYSNDLFKLDYGVEPKMQHVPWYLREDGVFTESGKRRGAYMVATFKDGGFHIGYLSIPQIEMNHRARSKAKDSGPWVTDYDDMCCKSVIRDNWKWLPYDTELTEKFMQADEDLEPEKVEFTVEASAQLPDPEPVEDVAVQTVETATQAPAESSFTEGADPKAAWEDKK